MTVPDPDEWQRKGATFSDKTARKEFCLTQAQIVAAIRAGHLHYREASMHGSPWLRLLRRQVEPLAKKTFGENQVRGQQAMTELGKHQLRAQAAEGPGYGAGRAAVKADRRRRQSRCGLTALYLLLPGGSGSSTADV